jgi:FkbM family methyltransferase
MKLTTKSKIKRVFMKIFGYQRMLYLIAFFRIRTFKYTSRQKEFIAFLNLIKSTKAPSDGFILDIGANIGVTAYYFSHWFPRSTVMAFEPVADNIMVLKQVVAKYHLGNVMVCDYGLGNEFGSFEIAIPIIAGVKQHTRATISKEVAQNYVTDTCLISIQRMDDQHQLQDHPVFGVKIDVEGYEAFVLQGGEALLKRDKPPIFCEVGEGENRSRVFQWIKALDYKIKVFDNGQLKDYNPVIHEQPGINFVNFFFLPNN